MAIKVYVANRNPGAAVTHRATIKASCDICGETLLEKNYWHFPTSRSTLEGLTLRNYDFINELVNRPELNLLNEVIEYLHYEGHVYHGDFVGGKLTCKFCSYMRAKVRKLSFIKDEQK